jgi:carbamate kinase
MITVAALGGNSLLDPKLTTDVGGQFARTSAALGPLAERIARGDRVAITHGNGPQVGYMLLRSDLAAGELHEVPLDSLVADSQGALGYMIERVLREELARLGAEREIVSIVTEVEVDPESVKIPPTKPVGRFYSAEEAERLRRERGWTLVEDAGRGFRRVVLSPRPVKIVELAAIRRLIDAGVIVIACGGGGIPVYRDESGKIHGIEGVVDKDLTSALFATELGASRLIITTGVDGVYEGFRSGSPARLERVTPARLRELASAGEFPPGSMGPKIEAALQFLEAGGEQVVICLPEQYALACEGLAGTRIARETTR